MLSFLAVTLTVVALTWLWYLRRKLFIPNVPYCPRGILGSIGYFSLERLYAFLEMHALKLGPIFQVDLILFPLIIVSDIQAVQHILKARPHDFRRDSAVHTVFNDMDISGIFSDEGLEWKASRNLAAPAFTASKVRTMNAVIIKHTIILKEKLSKFQEQQDKLLVKFFGTDTTGYAMNYDPSLLMEIGPIFQEFTMGLILEAIFGVSKSILTPADVDIANLIEVLTVRLTSILPWHKFYKSKSDLKCEKAIKKMFVHIDNVIQEYYNASAEYEATGKPNPFQNTIFESMILAASEESKQTRRMSKLSIEKVKRNLIHLIIAGTDTMSVQLQWITYYLAMNPDVLQKVQQEADAVFGSKSIHEVNQDDFPFCFNVIKEAMRLSPIAPLDTFQSNVEVEILGHKIPKGSSIFLLYRAASFKNNSIIDPFKFWPERWDALQDSKLLANTLLNFGGGPRICPGKNLAITDMILATAHALSSFDISLFPRLPSECGVTEVTKFTYSPQNFYPLFTVRRSRETIEQNQN